MSRVGRKVIVIPEGVKITVAGRVIKVTGPLGTLEGLLPEGVTLEIEGQTISVNEPELTRANRGFRGLVRALVANMVHGVVKGYEKQLEISGVGYKAELKGETLVFALGYTHPIVLKLPLGIKATVDKAQTGLSISGIDKQLVGQIAALIRNYKVPDPYKAKGVKYKGEVIKTKAGKTGTK